MAARFAKTCILINFIVTTSILPSLAQEAPPLVPTCVDGAITQDLVKTLIVNEANHQGVDVKLALAIAHHESGFGSKTNSSAGARGIMQLIPATAERYNIKDICHPEENIRGGISFIKDLTALFDANIMLIAAAYNAGEQRIIDAGGIPAITETVNYTVRVTNTYYGFDKSIGKRRTRSTHQADTKSKSTFAFDAARESPPPINRNQHIPLNTEWLGGSVLYVQ